MYIFKGTDNVGTYAFLNEVVSIADLVAYRNFLIINLVSSRKQPCSRQRHMGVKRAAHITDNNACTSASMVFFTDMYLQMLFIFSK